MGTAHVLLLGGELLFVCMMGFRWHSMWTASKAPPPGCLLPPDRIPMYYFNSKDDIDQRQYMEYHFGCYGTLTRVETVDASVKKLKDLVAIRGKKGGLSLDEYIRGFNYTAEAVAEVLTHVEILRQVEKTKSQQVVVLSDRVSAITIQYWRQSFSQLAAAVSKIHPKWEIVFLDGANTYVQDFDHNASLDLRTVREQNDALLSKSPQVAHLKRLDAYMISRRGILRLLRTLIDKEEGRLIISTKGTTYGVIADRLKEVQVAIPPYFVDRLVQTSKPQWSAKAKDVTPAEVKHVSSYVRAMQAVFEAWEVEVTQRSALKLAGIKPRSMYSFGRVDQHREEQLENLENDLSWMPLVRWAAEPANF